MSDQRGLHSKYEVRKVEDPTSKHDDCRFFVLDIDHDVHARRALRLYAAAVGFQNPELFHDLHRLLDEVEADRG